MNIFFIGVVVSILVYIVVGIWAGRSVKDVNDYYVSGRNAPTILIAGTLFASMLSVNGFMGDQGWCYSGNITTLVLLNSMCAMGYIAGPLMFGRYLRRSECTTMPEYFGARYCDLKNRRVAGIITAVSLTAYLLSCITGVGILMQELTGLSYELCLFLAWFCFTAFTFYSGSKGVILTDTMMFMVFLIATIIAGPYVFKAQGGIGHLLENLMNNPNIPENLLDYHGNIPGAGATDVFGAVMYAVTMGIIWFITVSVSPWQAGRNMMAKSEHVTFRAGAIAAACTVIFLMYLNLQSVTVLNLNPGMEDPQRVLIWAAFHVMPKLVGTLMLAGIMAAGLSSASTFLSVIGFSITSDIVFVEFKSEKQQLFVSRVIMLILGAISLLLAYTGIGSVRIVTYFASTIIAASWGVSAIDFVNGPCGVDSWRDANRRANAGYEHSLLTSSTNLVEQMPSWFRQEHKEGYQVGWTFDEQMPAGGEAAAELTVPFSTYKTGYFTYQEADGQYAISQHINGNDHTYVDGNTDEPVLVSNVLVLYTDISVIAGDSAGRMSVRTTGSGDGLLLRDGQLYPITWQRDSKSSCYRFLGETGEEIALKPGSSYINVVKTSAQVEWN